MMTAYINRYEPTSADILRRGVLLLVTGILPLLLLELFFETRSWMALDVPAPTHATTVIYPVTLNYEGDYTVAYRVESPKENELACLLGISNSGACLQPQPVVPTSWRLMKDGKIVAQGSTSHWRESSADMEGIESRIGGLSYKGKSFLGTDYQLEITLKTDLAQLAPYNPRLRMEIDNTVYVNETVTSIPFWLWTITLIPIGAYKVISGTIGMIRNR